MPVPFAEFYTAYYSHVVGYIRAAAGQRAPEQVEDLVQETFLRAFQAYERVWPGKEQAWITRIARNVTIDHFRAAWSRLRQKNVWEKAVMENIPDSASAFPERIANADLLTQALAGVTPKGREALLFWLKGYKLREVAARLDLDISTCSHRLTYAKEQLRKHYLALSQ